MSNSLSPLDCSTPGFPVLHQLPELAQTHVRRVGDPIQPSHPLSSPSPPAFNVPSIRVFSKEWGLRIRWPEYWSFSFSIRPSNEYSGLISFKMDWFDLKSLFQHHSSKASFSLKPAQVVKNSATYGARSGPLADFPRNPPSWRVFREARPALSADTVGSAGACRIQASFNRAFPCSEMSRWLGCQISHLWKAREYFANTWMPYQAGAQLWQCVGWSIYKRKKKLFLATEKSFH